MYQIKICLNSLDVCATETTKQSIYSSQIQSHKKCLLISPDFIQCKIVSTLLGLYIRTFEA